jgi:hypothetical protein
MGVYCYTLRKPTKTVDGIVIAQYAYAYKDHFFDKQTRHEALMHAAAERALSANYNVKHVVMGDWKYVESDEGLTVYAVSGLKEYFLDGGPIPNTIGEVGTLRKVGRKLVLTMATGVTLRPAVRDVGMFTASVV